MIVTLTPNPSIDRTVAVDALDRGEVHRATSSRVDAGGKGVNVSRALAAHGSPTVAVMPSGGPEGALMAELLTAAGVATRFVPVSGSLRTNIAVVEPDGTTTKLNEPGPQLTPVDIDALVTATLAEVDGAGWVVACGSLPPGAPSDLYAALVARVRGLGLRIAVDTSGSPLRDAVSALPDLVKPNHEELAELVGHPLLRLADVRAAAADLVAQGIGTVAVSLGAQGALLVTAEETLHAVATVAAPRSTVGAGDCMLAGLLDSLSRGAGPADALIAGVAWGAAAVTLPGSQVPTPADTRGIQVQLDRTPDPALTLA